MKKNALNKKGQAQYFMESAFRIGFLIVALFIFFLLINMYIKSQTNTQELTYHVVSSRIIHSDALMLEENGRIYSGIIDLNKLDDERLDKYIDYSNKKYATAKLSVIKNSDGSVIDTAYLNKKQYEQLKVLVDSGVSGKGSAKYYIKHYPITYKQANSYYYGTLIVEIMIPNS